MTRPMLFAASLATSSMILLSAALAGAQIVVNSTGDKPNAFPLITGVCSTDIIERGECTLRAAIQLANFNPDLTTITFNIPTTDQGYDAQTNSYTIFLNSSLDLATPIILTGPGADKLTIQANNSSQVILYITQDANPAISGLTLKNGATAIRHISTGTASVTDCVIANTGSTAVEIDSTGALYFIRCNISSNNRGIANLSTGTVSIVSISGCTIQSNISDSDGAGVYNNSGTVSVMNTTIDSNLA